MAEIRWTEESAQWLRDIYEYISADNLKAAEKVISTIFEKVQVLRDHPEIGHEYQTVIWPQSSYSSLRPLPNNVSYKEIRRYRYPVDFSWCP